MNRHLMIWNITLRLGIFLMLVLKGTTSWCQDTLYTKTHLPFAVKVIEISDTQIRYKNFKNLEGPEYVISKKKALKIVYQNGMVDSLIKPEMAIPAKLRNVKPFGWLKGKNVVTLVVSDLFFKMGTLNYERTFLSERLAIRIPLSIGFNAEGKDTNYVDYSRDFFFKFTKAGYYDVNKIFSTGIDIFVYPFKQGELNYFVGPSFGYGEFYQWTSVYYTNKFIRNNSKYYSILIRNGVRMHPGKNFTIVLNLGMGIYQVETIAYGSGYSQSYSTFDEVFRAVEGSICAGFRF